MKRERIPLPVAPVDDRLILVEGRPPCRPLAAIAGSAPVYCPPQERRGARDGCLDGHRPPLQEGGCRPHILLFSFLLAIAPVAQAQTNSTDTTTNASTVAAPAVTNTPDFDPLAAPVNVQNQNAPGNSSPQPDIQDIRPPFFFLHTWLWLWIALGLVGIIALLLLLWNWFKPTKQLNARTAYELTLEKLEKARALLREEEPMPYAVLVSETIRSYLGQRYQTPSTHRTTEEFLRQMQADPTTPLAEHRDLLRDFLQSCDLVKFARYQPTLTELEKVHEHAVSFVIATQPASLPSRQNGRLP